MTLMAVKEGVFRAYAQSDTRGRRKRRGEFVPVGTAYPEVSDVRPSARQDVPHVDVPPSAVEDVESDSRSELRVQYRDGGSGSVTLLVSGILDLSTVLPFRDAVFTAIGNRPRRLVVDVAQLGDADVAGISALVTAGRVARLMNVPFFVAPSPSLKSLLEETGICLFDSVSDPMH
jgi:anti-anti-sigma regulatory factor